MKKNVFYYYTNLGKKDRQELAQRLRLGGELKNLTVDYLIKCYQIPLALKTFEFVSQNDLKDDIAISNLAYQTIATTISLHNGEYNMLDLEDFINWYLDREFECYLQKPIEAWENCVFSKDVQEAFFRLPPFEYHIFSEYYGIGDYPLNIKELAVKYHADSIFWIICALLASKQYLKQDTELKKYYENGGKRYE